MLNVNKRLSDMSGEYRMVYFVNCDFIESSFSRVVVIEIRL